MLISSMTSKSNLSWASAICVVVLTSQKVVPLPPALPAVERSVETPRVLIPIGRGGPESQAVWGMADRNLQEHVHPNEKN